MELTKKTIDEIDWSKEKENTKLVEAIFFYFRKISVNAGFNLSFKLKFSCYKRLYRKNKRKVSKRRFGFGNC